MMYKSGGRYTHVDYIFEESRLSDLKKGMPKSTAAAQTSQLSSTGTMGYLHTSDSRSFSFQKKPPAEPGLDGVHHSQ